MRVPSANSSMDCVQPCSITRSGACLRGLPAGRYSPYCKWFTRLPGAAGAEWNERVHEPLAQAAARGRTRDSRAPRCGTSRVAVWRTFDDGFATPGVAGRVAVRVDDRFGLRLVVARACSVWIANRRFRPPSQILVKLFGIGFSR
ncbi:hypothetical protein BCAR13_1100018 [Paraburkholderia caribensis]|nr:hypothetical protein BCAR13_1100018 [Paraburkholderia caribensis]